MSTSTRRRSSRVPGTPRVISPSPDAPDSAQENGGYTAPRTRASTRRRNGSQKKASPDDSSDDPDLARARSRSREGDDARRTRRRLSGLTTAPQPLTSSTTSKKTAKAKANGAAAAPDPSKLLSPTPPSYWQRALSRSPSPLGLIPIHRTLRNFVHKHEIPRKVLHVSIGFVTLGLYATGYQTSAIHPVLLALLIPIAATDVLRHNVDSVNRIYIKALGALMRESEAHDRYNGVIWYLTGAWAVLLACPKDVAVVSIVLLSWCDTAASTIGRLYGRYTPQVRRGKSLAGSLAACVTGIAASIFFWGWCAPYYRGLGIADDTGANAFAFDGSLSLPRLLSEKTGIGGQLTGNSALAIVSAVAGLVASAAEAVDLWGLDDNLTIPLLCGLGLWGFFGLFSAGIA